MTTPEAPDSGEEASGAPSRYVTRPVEVTAMRYEGPNHVRASYTHVPYSASEFAALRGFCGIDFTVILVGSETHGGPNQCAPAVHRRTVTAPEGKARIRNGEWVVKTGPHAFEVLPPEQFETRYQVAPTDRRPDDA